MSLLLLGSSRCPLCGEVIEHAESAILLPAFLWNAADPLIVFNDASLHQRCFDDDPRHHEVNAILAEHEEMAGPGNRRCAVCEEEIAHPDEHFLLPFLRRDKTHPLHTFRYTHLHKHHIAEWRHLKVVLPHLRDLIREPGAECLQYLLTTLEEAAAGLAASTEFTLTDTHFKRLSSSDWLACVYELAGQLSSEPAETQVQALRTLLDSSPDGALEVWRQLRSPRRVNQRFFEHVMSSTQRHTTLQHAMEIAPAKLGARAFVRLTQAALDEAVDSTREKLEYLLGVAAAAHPAVQDVLD